MTPLPDEHLQHASNGAISSSIGLLDASVPIGAGAYLWSIARAAQDRSTFEAILQGRWFAFPWGAVAVASCVAARWLWRRRSSDRRPSPELGPIVAGAWLLHALGWGTGGQFAELALDYDRWCASLSSTWQFIPLTGTLHLVAVVLTAIEATRATTDALLLVLERREVTRPTRLFASAIGVLVALGGIIAVLQLATGSGRPW
jgi:hypothetical protein